MKRKVAVKCPNGRTGCDSSWVSITCLPKTEAIFLKCWQNTISKCFSTLMLCNKKNKTCFLLLRSKKHGSGCSKFWQIYSYCNSWQKLIIKGNEACYGSKPFFFLRGSGHAGGILGGDHLWFHRTVAPKLKMTRSTFDELCGAEGPLVAPLTPCPREPVLTERIAKKKK